jgi:primosomal protein N' (replication factor Y) (superfamily II helicase)
MSGRRRSALEGTAPREIEIIGPSAAPLARLKNQFRFHVAMRIPLGIEPSGIVRNALLGLPLSDRLSISIDIDPLSMA